MNKLDEVLNRIQEKWGYTAVQSARHLSIPEKVYPSGFSALDALIRGIPRSHLTEIVGCPTSGMTTFAYHSLASAQKQGANVVVIDSLSSLDLGTAVSYGVNLKQLVLVEIAELPLLLNLVHEILKSGVVHYLLVNLISLRQSNLNLRPLMSALHSSDAALVLLLPKRAQTEVASLRLQIQRENWLRQDGDIVGCLSSVTVEKQRFGQAGTDILLMLPFPEEAR